MIAFVNGKLDMVFEDRAVIDVNGIGYNVFISQATASTLPSVGEEVKLYTYTSVREDAIWLYGFLTNDELMLFKKLISVNGVGPKAGLSLLSFLTADNLRFAILSGDISLISKAQGIGKKTAERIVLDLKDKLNWNTDYISKEIKVNSSKVDDNEIDSSIKKEAVGALCALGYSSSDAHKAVNSVDIDDNSTVEDVLKNALKYLL